MHRTWSRGKRALFVHIIYLCYRDEPDNMRDDNLSKVRKNGFISSDSQVMMTVDKNEQKRYKTRLIINSEPF